MSQGISKQSQHHILERGENLEILPLLSTPFIAEENKPRGVKVFVWGTLTSTPTYSLYLLAHPFPPTSLQSHRGWVGERKERGSCCLQMGNSLFSFFHTHKKINWSLICRNNDNFAETVPSLSSESPSAPGESLLESGKIFFFFLVYFYFIKIKTCCYAGSRQHFVDKEHG